MNLSPRTTRGHAGGADVWFHSPASGRGRFAHGERASVIHRAKRLGGPRKLSGLFGKEKVINVYVHHTEFLYKASSLGIHFDRTRRDNLLNMCSFCALHAENT